MITYNVYTLFHVHNYRISFVFLVRNTIIVVFKYLQQNYKLIKIKRTEVAYIEDNDLFLFIKSVVYTYMYQTFKLTS